MPSKNSNNRLLALDIGATHTRIASFDNDLSIQDSEYFDTPRKQLAEKLNQKIIDFIKDKPDADGLAISVAGPVVGNKVIFTNIEGKPTLSVDDFTNLIPKTVIINDAAAAAYAESISRHCDNLVYITFSSGIGVGVIKDGNIVKFENTTAELGHIFIESEIDVLCGCGGKNHWEAFSSGVDIPNYYTKWLKSKNLDTDCKIVQDIYKEAEEGKEPAYSFISQEIGNINDYAINKIIELYRPEVIIIGGPVALENTELFLKGIKNETKEKTKLSFTHFGDDISLIGAANWYRNHIE